MTRNALEITTDWLEVERDIKHTKIILEKPLTEGNRKEVQKYQLKLKELTKQRQKLTNELEDVMKK
jgi:hypothetical protein